MIRNDIALGRSYVAEINGKIFGTFALVLGPDERYETFKGSFLNKGDSYVTGSRGAIEL